MLNEVEEEVRNELIKIAQRGNRISSRISYQELADLCGLRDANGKRLDMVNIDHRNELGHILGNISRHEDENKRPMLSALVFNEQIGQPGSGFFNLARELGKKKPTEDDLIFWASELGKVYNQWSK